jgi:transposase
MVAAALPNLDQLDIEALKTLVVAQHEQHLETISSQLQQIEHFKLVIEKLRRMIFGAKSEKVIVQVEQFELQLEDAETEQAASEEKFEAPASEAKPQSQSRPSRKPLPAHLPREVVTHLPVHDCCPDCGGTLRNFCEDVSEQLEYIPESFKMIRHVRPKFACNACERVVEAAAPARPIERGLAGPALLAHVLVSKFADHLPLYRQSEIYARQGVEIDRSTLAGWVGASSELLTPLVEALRKHVLSAKKIHADDTPVPVLAPGNGKTKTGRLWTYVRDERTAGENTAPAVWFAYSPDRKGEHPRQHLKNFKGALQADAYAGFHHLYDSGDVYEVACWAHYLENGFIWSWMQIACPDLGSEQALGILAPDNTGQRLSRKASSFGDGCHCRGDADAIPARFQKASSTSRFILRLEEMYRLVVATEACPR